MLQYNIIIYESMQLADITADAYKDKLLVVVVVIVVVVVVVVVVVAVVVVVVAVWFPDPSLAS